MAALSKYQCVDPSFNGVPENSDSCAFCRSVRILPSSLFSLTNFDSSNHTNHALYGSSGDNSAFRGIIPRRLRSNLPTSGANDMSQISLGMGRCSSCLFAFLLLASFLVSTSTQAQEKPTPTTPATSDTDPFKALQWRLIGPFRGGRSTAVAGVASQPLVYYFGGTGGGVWKNYRWRNQLGTYH